jgi:hypothetical protein
MKATEFWLCWKLGWVQLLELVLGDEYVSLHTPTTQEKPSARDLGMIYEGKSISKLQMDIELNQIFEKYFYFST